MPEHRYHPVARYLHWLVAALVVLQFVLANLAEDASSALTAAGLLANHRSVGITIFVLAVARLVWRQRQGVPPPLPMPGWQLTASQISHWTMYVLILVLPFNGWMLSSASGDTANWFGAFALPSPIAANEALAEKIGAVHGALAWLLFLAAVVHIGAALKHALLNRDGALRRIASIGTTAVFVLLVGAGAMTLTDAGGSAESARRLPVLSRDAHVATLDAWNIDYEASRVRFIAAVDGVPIATEWRDWVAGIRFDTANPQEGQFELQMTAASLTSAEPSRAATFMGADWFDAASYPELGFLARSFRSKGHGHGDAHDEEPGYVAAGQLTIKGRTVPLMLEFEVVEESGRRYLTGHGTFDRVPPGLGTGEWADTRRVERTVEIVVHVETID